MDYNQRILEVGGGKKPSKKVAAIVAEYEQALDVINHLEGRIENPEEDDDVSELQENLEDWTAEKEKIEEKFEKALVGWQNGMARIEHANRSRGSQASTTAQPQTTNQHVSPQSVNVNQPKVEVVVAEEVEEKKSGGYGWLIFGAIGLVLTLGAVNVMRRN